MLSRAALCNGKKIYPSYRWACNDAAAIREKKDKARSEVYRCRLCQGFHVGDAMVGHNTNKRPRAAPPGYDDE